MTPRVSVCVPTYNGAAFLAEALSSIAAQTLEDIEAVIVDDLSTDDTVAIAESYARADSRFRVVRNSERAGSGSANAKNCLRYASGEWLKFLAQDDFLAPECLARSLDAGAHGPLVVCWHDYKFEPGVAPDVRAWYESLATLASELPGDFADVDTFCAAILRQPGSNFIGPTSSGFIRRDCFTKYGAFDSAFSFFPDLDYWTRVGSNEGLAIAPERLLTYRVHEQSISGAIRHDPRRVYRAQLQILRRLLQFARDPRFANMRRVAASLPEPFDIEGRVRGRASDARWSAVDVHYHARDPWPLEQWDAFVLANPEIRVVLREIDATTPLVTRLRQFVKRRL